MPRDASSSPWVGEWGYCSYLRRLRLYVSVLNTLVCTSYVLLLYDQRAAFSGESHSIGPSKSPRCDPTVLCICVCTPYIRTLLHVCMYSTPYIHTAIQPRHQAPTSWCCTVKRATLSWSLEMPSMHLSSTLSRCNHAFCNGRDWHHCIWRRNIPL